MPQKQQLDNAVRRYKTDYNGLVTVYREKQFDPEWRVWFSVNAFLQPGAFAHMKPSHIVECMPREMFWGHYQQDGVKGAMAVWDEAKVRDALYETLCFCTIRDIVLRMPARAANRLIDLVLTLDYCPPHNACLFNTRWLPVDSVYRLWRSPQDAGAMYARELTNLINENETACVPAYMVDEMSYGSVHCIVSCAYYLAARLRHTSKPRHVVCLQLLHMAHTHSRAQDVHAISGVAVDLAMQALKRRAAPWSPAEQRLFTLMDVPTGGLTLMPYTAEGMLRSLLDVPSVLLGLAATDEALACLPDVDPGLPPCEAALLAQRLPVLRGKPDCMASARELVGEDGVVPAEGAYAALRVMSREPEFAKELWPQLFLDVPLRQFVGQFDERFLKGAFPGVWGLAY